MRAIIARHYKTKDNALDNILGWKDSPRGKGWKSDFEFVSTQLRDSNIRFDAVYSSDLERARQTAMFHASYFDIQTIRTKQALNEVNYGILYKKKKKWVASHYPEYKNDPDFAFPGGESFRQMQKRSVNCILSLAKKRPGQNILIVAHAGVIRGLISHFLDLDYAENLKRRISHRYLGDLTFDGESCVRYHELGKLSGFVKDEVIEVPVDCNKENNPGTSVNR